MGASRQTFFIRIYETEEVEQGENEFKENVIWLYAIDVHVFICQLWLERRNIFIRKVLEVADVSLHITS